MSSGPLRFLVLAVGLWICARAAILAPGWWPGGEAPPPSAMPGVSQSATTAAAAPAPAQISSPAAPLAALSSPQGSLPSIQFLIRNMSYKNFLHAAPRVSPPLVISAIGSRPRAGARVEPRAGAQAEPGSGARAASTGTQSILATPWSGRDGHPLPARAVGAPDRLSISAWVLARHEPGASALAPGGALGGSQAGGRISYRLGGGLALSGRVYLPLRRVAGAEAAAGLDWRPVAAIPVNILAERRQALGGEGRSAFALTLSGGGSRALPRRLRLDAYGQAGIVGARRRDLFVDGAIRVAAPIGPIEIGLGARGAAQPGAARLDAGPSLAWRLPLRGANVRIEADWRFRVAGGAAPGSGPALTLATDF